MPAEFPSLRIAFVGGGAMATALIGGFLNSGVIPSASQISVSDPSAQQREKIHATIKPTKDGTQITVEGDNSLVVSDADVVFLAVKPQVMESVLRALSPSINPSQLIVSIAAGVTIQDIESQLEGRVVRVMPNTPAFVQEMASGYSLGSKATTSDGEIVRELISSMGDAFLVREDLLDAVTGLSGSGPAYIFIMIEALADGGVRSGLPRNVAMPLAARTVLGAAKMVLETGKHPGELKDMVTSPGGTTIAGVHELERAGFRSALINAVYAATNRSKELSKI